MISDENFSGTNADGSDATTNMDTRDCMVYGIMNVEGTYHIVVYATAGGTTYYDTGIPSTSKEPMHIRVVYDNDEEFHDYDPDNKKHTYNKVDMKIFVNGVLVGERENVKLVGATPNGVTEKSCAVVAYMQSAVAMEFSVKNMRFYKAPSELVDDTVTNNTDDFNGPQIYAPHLTNDPALNGKIEEKGFYLNGKLSDTVDFGIAWNTNAIFLSYKKSAGTANLKITIAGEVVTIPVANIFSASGDYVEVKIPWSAVNFKVLNYDDSTTLKIELGELTWNGKIFFTYGMPDLGSAKPTLYAGDATLYLPKKGGGLVKQDGTGASHSGFRWLSVNKLASSEANTVIEYDFVPINLPAAPGKIQVDPHNWYAATFVISDENFSGTNADGSDATTNMDTRDCMVYGIMNVEGTYHIVVYATAGGTTYYDTGIPSTSKEPMHIRVVYDNDEEFHNYDPVTKKHTYNKVDMKIFVNGVFVGARGNVKVVGNTPNGVAQNSCVVVAYKQSGAAMEFSVEKMIFYKAPSSLSDVNPYTGDNMIAIAAALLVASMAGIALLAVPAIRKKLI